MVTGECLSQAIENQNSAFGLFSFLGFDLRGQTKSKGAAVAGLAADVDLAAVGAGDFAADGQPQTRAARAQTAGFVGAPKTLKDALLLFGVEAYAVVADFDPNIAAAIARADADRAAFGPAVMNGVAQEVIDHAPQSRFVGDDRQIYWMCHGEGFQRWHLGGLEASREDLIDLTRLLSCQALDAVGSYPLFQCSTPERLGEDIEALGDDLVSISMVLDPFAAWDPSRLQQWFPDVCIPFKQHDQLG